MFVSAILLFSTGLHLPSWACSILPHRATTDNTSFIAKKPPAHTVPLHPPLFQLFIYRQMSQPKKEESITSCDFQRIMWVCGETGCLCQSVLARRYGNDERLRNSVRSNEGCRIRASLWLFWHESHKFKACPHYFNNAPNGSPFSSSFNRCVSLEWFYREENSGKILAHVKQRGWGSSGVKNSLINLLQLFPRLFGNISCYKPFATLAASQCCCSGSGKGNVLEWRDARRGWQDKSGPNSAKQWKCEKTWEQFQISTEMEMVLIWW